MIVSRAERRQVENEMIFRRSNEKARDDIKALDLMHIKDGTPHLIKDENLLLHFTCECSDENCTSRIPMLMDDYQKIHADRDKFIVLPGHQVDIIEKVLKKTPEYNVVLKNVTIPEPVGTLNETAIDNS